MANESAAPAWKDGNTGAPLPPLARGLPVLGSALRMREEPLAYLLELYRTLGPIYRVRALNREFTVMAGLDANQFLSRAGEEYLGSRELFGGFAEEMRSDVFLVAMDGEPHRRLRKLMRRGFSREAIVPHVRCVIDMTRAAARQWQPGQVVTVVPAMQRIVTEQLGVILGGHALGPDFEPVWRFLNTIMTVLVLKTAPGFMLRRPAYLKAKARVFALGEEVLAEHRAHPPGPDRPADLIDDMLAAHVTEPDFISREALLVSTVAPFFAGMDTVANTCSFMLYALLSHPAALERVLADADALVARESITLQDLKGAQALYGATLETLRMFPVAAFTPRSAVKPFEFAGCRVETGAEVLIGNGVTHYLPEYFPEPHAFDIDRYREPRNEHRRTGVFAPYSLGAHTCLGAGLAEVQIMLCMAALLQAVRLELVPPGYRAKTVLAPIPSPGQGLKVRVIGSR